MPENHFAGTPMERLEKNFINVLVNHAVEGMFVHSLDGDITWSNPAMATLFGYPSPETVTSGVTVETLFFENEDYAWYLQALDDEGEIQGADVQFKRKDGSLFWGEIYSRIDSEDSSDSEMVLGWILDISERKHSEEVLNETEFRYRHLLDVSPDAIVVYGLNGELLFANPAFSTIYGWQFSELAGKKIDFVPSEELDRSLAGIHKALAGNEVELETRRFRKDGNLIDVHLKFAPHYDAQGNVKGIYVVHRDLTRERRQESRFKDLFDNISDFVFTHDLAGRILTVNPAASYVLGIPAHEMIGKPFMTYMPEADQQRYRNDYLRHVVKDGHYHGMMVLKDSDGRDQYVEFRSIMKSISGKDPVISGIGRVVTEKIKAEKELDRVKEQLLQAQKMEAIGTLTSGISKEFNNILQSMIQPLYLLQGTADLSPKDKRFLEIVRMSALRGADLVRQLMTFSRRVEPRLESISLADNLLHAVDLLRKILPKTIDVVVEIPDGIQPVKADPSQIQQILVNLGVNARDAMNGEHGTLSYDLRQISPGEVWLFPEVPPGSYNRITIQDTGCGIPEAIIKKIFEPFFTTKDFGKGTGLGLSMVYGIVQSHGGYITCESKSGVGTTFRIFLPVQESGPGSEGLTVKKVPAASASGQTILVVDDEVYIREIIAEALKMAGFEVLEADDGKKALEVYKENQEYVICVIMDLNMPVMSGREALQAIHHQNPDVPVIIATGSSDPDEIEEIIGQGAFDVLKKPYTSRELLKVVRRIIPLSV